MGMSEVVIPYVYPIAVITVFSSREMSKAKTVGKRNSIYNTYFCMLLSNYASVRMSTCRTQKYSDKVNHQGDCTGFQVCISLRLVNRISDSVNENLFPEKLIVA
jgi:hypothetical protein